MAEQRLQKILAQAGISSRRKAEELILEGLVTVNGQVAKIGDKAEWGKDAIKVQGKLLLKKESPVYVAFHKPRGVISMVGDPEGRPSLADYISQIEGRVFPVGRLDFNSEGLILLTNDGEFAEKVQKSPDIARVYHVKVKGHPGVDSIRDLQRGSKIEGKIIQPHSVRLVKDFEKKSLIEIVFVGSGAIDVRALIERKKLLFERITRVNIGHLGLRDMKPGEFRYLEASQVEALYLQPELGMRKIAEKGDALPRRLREEVRRNAFEDAAATGSQVKIRLRGPEGKVKLTAKRPALGSPKSYFKPDDFKKKVVRPKESLAPRSPATKAGTKPLATRSSRGLGRPGRSR